MSRLYSNNQVKKAGKVLKSALDYSDSEVEFAQNVLTYWRTIHAIPLNTFQGTLRSKLKKLGFSDALVAQRIKRSESIVSKLGRERTMKLSTMQDIAGLRAVVKNIEQVRNLEENYRATIFSHSLINEVDYIQNPAHSGYRGIHLIYEYSNPSQIEADGLKLELQLRTLIQHAWATAVETMGTFLEKPLKSSQGPEDWLLYFRLVSAGFALLEKTPVPAAYQDHTMLEVFSKIRSESVRLQVNEKLSAFTVAVNHISQRSRNSKYHLITLNTKKRVVSIKNYSGSQLAQANIDYTNIEKEVNSGAPIQAVLVSAGSIENLRKAYPNYFLDTKEFIDKLEIIYHLLRKMESK
jgi:ppGpp synthetase/RelA/SpoT-type nucleotidyltranferase